jgi:hypothetical protein
MKEKLTESAQRAQTMENTLRDFGVKPVEGKREELYNRLLEQKEKYLTIERIHGKSVDRDLSR